MKEAHWKRDKNLRDVLVHLYEWHQLLLNWFNSNQNGDTKTFLPEPYNSNVNKTSYFLLMLKITIPNNINYRILYIPSELPLLLYSLFFLLYSESYLKKAA
jgi:hypothetical protein